MMASHDFRPGSLFKIILSYLIQSYMTSTVGTVHHDKMFNNQLADKHVHLSNRGMKNDKEF